MKSFLHKLHITHASKPIISSPHNESGSPQPFRRSDAAGNMPAPIAANPQRLFDSVISVPGASGKGQIAQAEREPFCTMDALKFAPRHLEKMSALRATCASTYQETVAKALDGIVMMTAASEAITAFRARQGNPAWKDLDLSAKGAMAALEDTLRAQFSKLTAAHGANLESVSPYPQQARDMAFTYVAHLAVSIAYDQGTKIPAHLVASELNVKWSQSSADAALMDAFAPVIREADPRATCKVNWMGILDILVHASKYAAADKDGPRQASEKPSQTGKTPASQAETPRAPATAEAAAQTEYEAAMAEAMASIAQAIGKQPPLPGIAPKCAMRVGGVVAGPGNLTAFFDMSATDKSPEAQAKVKRQYRDTLRAIHPDKHAGCGYEAMRAFLEMTKLYTAAYDEANKWFASPGA